MERTQNTNANQQDFKNLKKLKKTQPVEVDGIQTTWGELQQFIAKNVLEVKANDKYKDTVFLLLCAESKQNLLDIFACLHPEIPLETLDVDKIQCFNLRCSVTNGVYNDLSILYEDKILVFLEAQSTWNENMPVRLLGYSARVLEQYIAVKNLNVYASAPIKLPFPEFFILLVGRGAKAKNIQDELSLRLLFSQKPSLGLSSEPSDSTNFVDLSAKVLYNGSRKHQLSGLLLEYSRFAEFADAFFEKNGRNPKAIAQVIKSCIERGILADFFSRHFSEVVDMLERNFHDENAWIINAKASRMEGFKEGKAEGLAEGKAEGLADGRSLERQEAIARIVNNTKSSNQQREDAVNAISMVFGLSSEEAEKAVDTLW